MAKCNNCGSENAYYPFHGPVECANSSCEFFNNDHYLAMKKDIESRPTEPQQLEMNYEINSEDDEDNPYGLPTASDVFKAYSSGQTKK